MWNWIVKWVPLLALLGLFVGLTGCGPTTWGVEDGQVKIVLRPAIVWKVNTGLYFYGGEEAMVEVTANAAASGTVQADKVGDPGESDVGLNSP